MQPTDTHNSEGDPRHWSLRDALDDHLGLALGKQLILHGHR